MGSPFAVFDRVPAEIFDQIGRLLDGPSLMASLQVDRRWHTTLRPLVWSRLSFRQWHHPSFPSIRTSDLSGGIPDPLDNETITVFEEDDHRPRFLKCIRHLEWWTNDSFNFSSNNPNTWVYPIFITTLTPSEALAERAFANRGVNRNGFFSHFQDWCYCGRKGRPPPFPSQCRPEIPVTLLTKLLTGSNLPSLTSLSLRFGPRLDLDVLMALKELPKTLKTLRLVCWDFSTSQIEIQDLFPILERLDELELKGNWFSPETPQGRRETGHEAQPSLVQVQQEYRQLIRRLQEPQDLAQDGQQRQQGYKPWRLKRLSVKFEGLYLVGFCPGLEELHLDFFVPYVRFYYQVRGAGRIVSFLPLQECQKTLKVLKFWRVCGMETYSDLVESWSRFDHLTDLSYTVTEVDQIRFLCEDRRHPHKYEQDQEREQVESDVTSTTAKANTTADASTEDDSNDDCYALPHLQHLEVRGSRLVGPAEAVFSECLRILLMTRKRLLTFKVRIHSIDMGFLFPATKDYCNGSDEDLKQQSSSRSPPSPLSSPMISRRFWACTRLQVLHLLLHYPNDPEEAPNIFSHSMNINPAPFSQETKCAFWRPVYEQIAELSDITSLTLVCTDFQKGPKSGILQWSQDKGCGGDNDAGATIDHKFDGRTQEADTKEEWEQGESSACPHEYACLGHLVSRESKLPQLQYLTFQLQEGGQTLPLTKEELALLVFQLPSLKFLNLKTLDDVSAENARSWLRELCNDKSNSCAGRKVGQKEVVLGPLPLK